jgi:RNA-directed DNA polymerase
MIAKVVAARNLSDACKKVVRNKGSAGIDGMPTTELKAFIDAHRSKVVHQLISKSYRPQAIKGVEIPKPNGKTRLLGVPTVVDRWLQQAVLKSQGYIKDGYQDLVDIDLKSFFDEVQHYKLLQLIYNKVKCPTTLWLIRKWLRAPILKNGRLHKRRKGLPQGSPLSPLLSNIMLDQLDKHLKTRGFRFIRYADDFSIYTKSKAAARAIGNEVFLFLKEKLDLPVNRAKSGIRRPSTFKVLGYRFTPVYKKGVKGHYQLIVSEQAWQTLKRKLRYLTKKTLPLSLVERLQRLKPIYKGWLNNFRLGNIHTKLKKLDEWLRNRLRYCIWHDWKKPERKRKNLIGLGIKQGQAYAWSRTRMGGWAVAQSPILRTTITEKRLRKRGYESMLAYYFSVKF